MAFRQAENKVKIEGILNEIDLKYGSFTRNGEPVETIGGTIKVIVPQEVNGVTITNEIPVYMFSTKLTRAGKVNPSYESIEKVMKEFVSVAAAGSAEQADKIRITNADIRMNEFIGQDGRVVSQPRVHASFVSKVIGNYEPTASFSLEFMVSSMNRVTDNQGVELDPAKLNVRVVVPQYTSPSADVMNVDLVPLYVTSANAITAIEENWEAGKCYKINGRLNFTSKTEEVYQEVDFGEAQKKTRTISTSEFIITGGTLSPLDDEYAWPVDEIKAGMANRETKLNDLKAKGQAKKVPAQNTSKGITDLGF